MIRLLAAAAALVALAPVAPARAQTIILPQFGLQAQPTAGCRQLTVRDRDAGAPVTIGCLGSGNDGLRLTPRGLGIAGISPLDLTLSTRNGAAPALYRNPNAIRLGAGNAVSFCPSMSCLEPGDGAPTNDHQRTSLLVSAETQDDAHSEEQTLAVTTTISTGQRSPWSASTSYPRGANIFNQGTNSVYRQVAAGGCTSAGTGSGPVGRGTGIADGTCRWDWINDSAIATKLGAYIETKAIAGAGFSEGLVNNFEVADGFDIKQGFNGVEFDTGNFSGTDCTKSDGCNGVSIAFTGPNKITTGLQIYGHSGPAPLIWGIRLVGGNVASDIDIDVGSNADIGLGFGANGIDTSHHAVATIKDASTGAVSYSITGDHTVASIEDKSSSPVFASIGGTKSIAAISDTSVSPTGVLLQGTYSGAQIRGNGWAVDPSGGITTVRLNSLLTTPPSSSSSCTAGDWAHDANFVYTCVAANTWKRAALSSW